MIKNSFLLKSFLTIIGLTLLLVSCETSRVAPEVPRPNPAPPPPQAVILSGNVIDAETGGGIASVTVSLTKLDGAVVSTAVTNASGLYSFNLTALNITDSTLNVTTNVTGYGYGFRVATFDKANGTAGVVPIVLTKIANVTTVTLGASGGAASTTPTADSKASTPVSVTVPPNAVPANTQVTLAAVPVVSIPPPSTPLTQNVLSSNNLAATGVTTFSQQVTMTFNLPFPLTAGTTIPVLLLNTTTNKWESSGLNAVVSANGLTAIVQVTRPGNYALLGNVSVAQTVSGKFIAGNEDISVTKLEKEIGTANAVIELSPAKLTATYNGPANPPPLINLISGTVGQTPTTHYSFGLINHRFGTNLSLVPFLIPGFSKIYTYNLPATINGAPTSRGGVIIGPSGKENESGDWIYKITLTTLFGFDLYRIALPQLFEVEVAARRYIILERFEWVWRAHNQGGGN